MSDQTCLAGFARLDITGFLGQHIGGYYVERIAQGVDDPLYVNAVAFRQGKRTGVLLVCDMLGIYSDAAFRWPREVAAQLGLSEDSVILCSTHSHTTPVLQGAREPSDPMYDAFFRRRMTDAAALAIQDLKPVTDVLSAQGEAPGFAFVRRYYYKDGHFQTWCTDPELTDRPGSEGDDSIRLVRILRQGGKEIALTNFQFHPDNIGSCRYSADYPGAFRTHMERLRDVHCVYLDGAEGQLDGDGGLQVPLPGGHERMTGIGQRLAEAVLPLFDRAVSTGMTGLAMGQSFAHARTKRDPDRLAEALRLIELHESGRDGEIGPSWLSVPLVSEAYTLRRLEEAGQDWVALPVSAMVFCGAAFVGIPGEPFCEIGKHIRAASPFPVTNVCCQANGSQGYLPIAQAYDQGGYEPRNTRFVKGVGELLMDTADRLLAQFNTQMEKEV